MYFKKGTYYYEIRSRDLLNVIHRSKPVFSVENNQPRLIFQSYKKLKGEGVSALGMLIAERNIIAHKLDAGAVYAALDTPDVFSAIKDVLRKQIPNLKRTSKSDLITLISGVPESLLTHAYGTLIFRFLLLVD